MSSASVDLGGLGGGGGGGTPTGTPLHWAAFDASGNLFALPPWIFSSSPLLDYGWIAQQQPTVNPDNLVPIIYGINSILASVNISDNVVNNKPYLWRLGIAFDEVGNGFNIGEFGMWYGQTNFSGGGLATVMNGIYMLHSVPGDGFTSSGEVVTNTVITARSDFASNVSADTSIGLSSIHTFAGTAFAGDIYGVRVQNTFSTTNTIEAVTGLRITDTIPLGAAPSVSHHGIVVDSAINYANPNDIPSSALIDKRVFTGSAGAASDYVLCNTLCDQRVFQTGSDMIEVLGILLQPTLADNSSDIYYGMVINPITGAGLSFFIGIEIDYNGTSPPLNQPPFGVILNNCGLNVNGYFQSGAGYAGYAKVNYIGGQIALAADYASDLSMVENNFFIIGASNVSGVMSNVMSNVTTSIQANKTLTELNCFLSKGTIAGFGGVTPVLSNVSHFYAKTFIGNGHANTITNLYGLRMDQDTSGNTITNYWGLYIDATSAENYLAKSLAIGTTAKTVTNSSVALEIGGTTTSIRFPVLTTTQKNALTPLAGMQVYDTTLHKMSYYNGTSWISP